MSDDTKDKAIDDALINNQAASSIVKWSATLRAQYDAESKKIQDRIKKSTEETGKSLKESVDKAFPDDYKGNQEKAAKEYDDFIKKRNEQNRELDRMQQNLTHALEKNDPAAQLDRQLDELDKLYDAGRLSYEEYLIDQVDLQEKYNKEMEKTHKEHKAQMHDEKTGALEVHQTFTVSNPIISGGPQEQLVALADKQYKEQQRTNQLLQSKGQAPVYNG